MKQMQVDIGVDVGAYIRVGFRRQPADELATQTRDKVQ